MHFSSASVAYLETSYIPFNDCFAAVANCYGDEAVAPSIFVSISSLFSFHCLVTDVKIHRKSAILGGGTFCSGGNVSAKVFIFR